MSFKSINSAAIVSFETSSISIEVNIDNRGFPNFEIVGLAAKEINESRERIKSAIRNSGYKFPSKKIIVNLSPADLPKKGTFYDVPIALGILSCSGLINIDLTQYIFIGELSLNGDINKISGATLFAIHAKLENKILVIPEDNLPDVNFIDGLRVLAYKNLKELVNEFQNEDFNYRKTKKLSDISYEDKYKTNIENISGHELAKRALIIAAAGKHNICIVGSAGSGKTLLAEALHSIVTNVNENDFIEIMKINSVIGRKFSLIPEFRTVNYPITKSALFGTATPFRLGELTLAHKGILFIDEFSELDNSIIDSLRKPIEDKEIKIHNKKQSLSLPCDFLLVICANPCSCGNYSDPNKKCVCTDQQLQKYLLKLKNPLMDRIDIFINVFSIDAKEMLDKNETSTTSRLIKKRLTSLRDLQIQIFKKLNLEFKYNSQLSPEEIKIFCKLDKDAQNTLSALGKRFSSRSIHKIMKVSKTISDLDNSDVIKQEHLLEAIQYKSYLL